MKNVSTIGLDLGKTVFQVHGVDEQGAVTVRRALRRSQVLDFFARLAPCLVGLEACAGAYYWARELRALGHDARLIPPAYAKAYVRRNKNDAGDAPGARAAGQAAHHADQPAARADGGVRHCRGAGARAP